MPDQPENPQRVSLRAILTEKELWLLALLGILYFYRPLFEGETFFFRDLFSIFLTQKQLLTDFLRAGELPLWDPYMHGGRPYLANALNSALYPSNLLYVFLPFFKAFNLNIVLHLLGYLACAYLFARIVGLQPVASLITGISYGFCGYTLSLINLLNMFLALTHLPLLLLCWHLCLGRRQRRWLAATVLAGVVQVFAGSPEISLISVGLLLGWGLCYPYAHLSCSRRIGLWLLMNLFIAGIAAIQIVPQGEILAQSSRGAGTSYTAWSQWSLPPRRLPELVFPEFSGQIGSIRLTPQYWGGQLSGEGLPLILSIYLGGIAFTFAIVGGLHRGAREILPFRVRIFFLSVFLGSLLLSLGRFLPFFHFLYQHLPFMTFFRYPTKFLSAGIFPCALLVGYTAEVYFGNGKREWFDFAHHDRHSEPCHPEPCHPERSRRAIFGFFWGIAAFLLLLTLLFLYSDNFAQRFAELFFMQPGGDVLRRGVGVSLRHAAAVWLAFTLLCHYRRLRKTWWQSWMLAGILLLDLTTAGKNVNPYAPEKLFTEVPELAQVVRQELGEGKLLRTADPPFTPRFADFPDDLAWLQRWTLEVLNNTFATFFNIPLIFHTDFDRLASAWIMHLKTLSESIPWKQRLPLLSAAGVTLIITADEIALPEVERLREIPNWSATRLYLYRNKAAAGRVRFVTHWQEAKSDADALGSMLHPRYDPRQHVILQPPQATWALLFARKPSQGEYLSVPINSQQSLHLQAAAGNPAICGAAQIQNMTANRHSAVFSVVNPCAGYLVFAEPFYPGWQVTIDGRPTPVFRADYAFSAVFLPAGKHEVKRWYRPAAVVFGAWCSVGCCALLAIGLLSKIMYHRRTLVS